MSYNIFFSVLGTGNAFADKSAIIIHVFLSRSFTFSVKHFQYLGH